MSIPTKGETYAQLLEHLIKAQEASATLAHLSNTDTGRRDALLAQGWLGVAELLRRMQHQITRLAQGQLH